MKAVTVFGGAGAKNTLLALKGLGKVKVHSVPSVFDSGGSTGEIRRNFKIYALGDLREHLIAASGNKRMASILSSRINAGDESYSLGNLLLLNMAKKHGSRYIDVLHKLLAIPKNIRVTPVISDVNYTGNLVIYSDRGKLVGESNLDANRKIKVRDVKLEEKAAISDEVRRAIRSSDYIIFGPGDLYSSLIPNLLVDGVLPAIKRSKAKRVLITNIMNKVSETSGFNTSDFVHELGRFGLDFDRVISNGNYPGGMKRIRAKYGYLQGFVRNDMEGENITEADLLNEETFYEHDPQKLGRVLADLLLK